MCIVHVLIVRVMSAKDPGAFLAFRPMMTIIYVVLLFVLIREGGCVGLTPIHRGEG